MPVVHIAHVGICVSDLERSRHFYRDLLGFRERSIYESTEEASRKLLQLPEVELTALFLERDGMRIELLHFTRPGVTAGPEPRPMNQRGLTHIAMRVEDLDGLVASLCDAGGTRLDDTEIVNPAHQARAIIVLDPDGTRLELIESPGDPTAPIGQPLS